MMFNFFAKHEIWVEYPLPREPGRETFGDLRENFGEKEVSTAPGWATPKKFVERVRLPGDNLSRVLPCRI